nr:hypothetical protein JVH1_3953 [Rhodococcus sp. JVH1]
MIPPSCSPSTSGQSSNAHSNGRLVPQMRKLTELTIQRLKTLSMWADQTRSSSSPKSHRTELHPGRARLTPTGTILRRNPEIASATAALKWSTLPNSVFTVPSRVCA